MRNTQVSLYAFLRNHGRCIGGTEQTAACYGVSCNSSFLVSLDFCEVVDELGLILPATVVMLL